MFCVSKIYQYDTHQDAAFQDQLPMESIQNTFNALLQVTGYSGWKELVSGGGICNALAIIFAVVIILVLIVLSVSNFGDMASGNRQLKITIPENLNYTDAFNEVFDSYTTNSQLRKVKTTNMGTLFELTYTVALKKDVNEKNFIDALRVKNGNLNIVLGIPETESTNLN